MIKKFKIKQKPLGKKSVSMLVTDKVGEAITLDLDLTFTLTSQLSSIIDIEDVDDVVSDRNLIKAIKLALRESYIDKLAWECVRVK
jgi:hypothetical protein